MSFIEFENVSKIYRTGDVVIKAADGIDFHVEKGEFCIIVGPSGAGKTTVLNMLGGMDAASEGRISVDGTISEDERADFEKIKDELDKMSLAVDSLKAWFDEKIGE